MQKRIDDAGARVLIGYPPWLRVFLMRDVIAITLGRTIYVRSVEKVTDRLIIHELTHVRQQTKHGRIVFSWLYTTEFLKHWWRERDLSRAYRSISFEVEANAEEEHRDV